MHIVLVYVKVKPEFIEAFKAATLENAQGSVQEAGIARFDFVQQADDPTRFALIEVYHSKDAQPEHWKTAHYLKWRETVAEMMDGERTRATYVNVFPDDTGW